MLSLISTALPTGRVLGISVIKISPSGWSSSRIGTLIRPLASVVLAWKVTSKGRALRSGATTTSLSTSWILIGLESKLVLSATTPLPAAADWWTVKL